MERISNSYCQKITQNKYFPFFLAGFLMLLHFLSGYPGGMTPDSMDQFNQALVFNFSSHHPPLMAILWSGFNFIYKGPQLILLFQLGLIWGGALFLYYGDQ